MYNKDNKEDLSLALRNLFWGYPSDLLDDNVFNCCVVFNYHDRRQGFGDQARAGRDRNPDALTNQLSCAYWSVRGPERPCKTYASAEGIGMDGRFNHPTQRLQAGLLQFSDEHANIFRTARVWVTNMLDESYFHRPYVFRLFGRDRETTTRVPNGNKPQYPPGPGKTIHHVDLAHHGQDSMFTMGSKRPVQEGVGDYTGIVWNFKYSYSLFYQVRRHSVITVGTIVEVSSILHDKDKFFAMV